LFGQGLTIWGQIPGDFSQGLGQFGLSGGIEPLKGGCGLQQSDEVGIYRRLPESGTM
jgi:hypothetical protein